MIQEEFNSYLLAILITKFVINEFVITELDFLLFTFLFSECSQSCGLNSIKRRERGCKDGKYGGDQCVEVIDRQQQTCLVPDCPSKISSFRT